MSKSLTRLEAVNLAEQLRARGVKVHAERYSGNSIMLGLSDEQRKLWDGWHVRSDDWPFTPDIDDWPFTLDRFPLKQAARIEHEDGTFSWLLPDGSESSVMPE